MKIPASPPSALVRAAVRGGGRTNLFLFSGVPSRGACEGGVPRGASAGLEFPSAKVCW